MNHVIAEAIGRAVKMVMASGVLSAYGGVQTVRRQAEQILKNCDGALAAFPMPDAEEDAA